MRKVKGQAVESSWPKEPKSIVMGYVTMRPRVNVGDYVNGERDAPTMIIAFGDYMEEESRKLSKTLMQVMAMNREDMAYVFRCLPDREANPLADMAGRAVQAAGLQGKYWQMHQKLFETSETIDKDRIYYCAEQLGLDLDLFEKDINGQKCLNRLMLDIETAHRCGAEVAPALFVNDRRYDGNLDAKELNEFIHQK